MIVKTTRTPEEQTDLVPAQTGSEEEAIAAFNVKHQPADTDAEDEEETDEAEPDHEPEADEEEEPSDGEPDSEDEPKGELVEVEFEGETYELPEKLQKALMRQADYSRKIKEVSTKEKDYTQRIERADKLIEGAEKYAESLGSVRAIDAELKRFEEVKWQDLRHSNPGEFAALAAEMQSLRLTKDDEIRKAQALDVEIAKTKGEDIAAKQAEMFSVLKKDLKGWGDELGKKITGYALKAGYQPEELRMLTDPKAVIALNKARLFDELQDAKKTLKSKAQDAPKVVKPGAKRPPTNNAAEAMARLRITSSPDDAVAAFMARAQRG